MLICGHKCKGMCGDKCAPENCKELVSIDDKELGCGHRKLWVLCCDKYKGNCSITFLNHRIHKQKNALKY